MAKKRIISFENKPDCIICLNGDLPSKKIFGIFDGVPVLCADGGSNKIISYNIFPDFIIGDLDSVSPEIKDHQILKNRLIFEPSQDLNDFEKVLNFAIARKFKNVLIFGIHGGDFEHSLNNWSIIKKFQRRINLTILDKSRYCFPCWFDFEIDLGINELISIIPQPKALLTTSNLNWELNNEVLELGKREGTRNFCTYERIGIKIHKGSILFFINHRLPYVVNFKN